MFEHIKIDLILHSPSLIDKARLLSSFEKESGYWLHSLPSSALGTKLDNDTFRIAFAIRCGAPIWHPYRCQLRFKLMNLDYPVRKTPLDFLDKLHETI